MGAKGARRHSLPPDGQGAQGVAVVALSPGNEMGALRLSDFHKVLSCHLQGGFHRLGTTADQIDMAHALWRCPDELVCELFCRPRAEEAGVCVCELVDLGMHRCNHVWMPVPQ